MRAKHLGLSPARGWSILLGLATASGVACTQAADPPATSAGMGTTGTGGVTGGPTTTSATGSTTGNSCPSSQSLCDGACVSLASDTQHCGSCDVACEQGATCQTGTCSCGPAQTNCNGVCSDLSSDPTNCGSCGNACPALQVCSAGACAEACAEGMTACNGQCADTEADSAHCGSCDNACGAGQSCNAGACACLDATLTLCAGTNACIDTRSDAAHCGSCDNACGAGQTCEDGACTGSTGSGGTTGGTTTGATGGQGCDVAVYDPANPPQTLSLSGNLGTHDPVIMEEDGVFYEFQTGPRVAAKTSNNLTSWNGAPSALGNSNPAWISQQVPGATDLWAPDISLYNGQYHLYYSASTFGSNDSCIGHATRASLASGNWADHGSVVCTQSSNDYNAIDPNLIVDENGTAWLVFGSFWDGIRAIELDQDGARANDEVHAIASRGGGAIEAPFVVRRCGYYYLFVSFDKCCQGANSTYNIRVGRSESVLGPYVDQSGKAMLDGGGTLLVEGDNTWKGPGHNAVIFVGDKAYNVYHAYAATNGASQLRISELAWDDSGWPISAGP